MAHSPRNDPAWKTALDWLLRLHAAPDDPDLRARRDAWLVESEAHRRAYARAERVWRLTGDVSAPHARRPPAVAVQDARRMSRRRALGLGVGALAASVAVAVAPAALRYARADHRTGTGEIRSVTLADGSMVGLDTRSAIAVDFTSGRRAVGLLEGQAFFNVVPDAARPFTVSAGEVSLTLSGTAFDLRLAEDTVSVMVQSGAVSVGVGDAPQRLTAGEGMTVHRASGTISRRKVDPDQVAAWLGGRLAVDGITVVEVVDELRRYHPGLILLRDRGLGLRRVTGVFDLHDPARALEAAVAPYAGRVREPLPFLLVVDAG